MVNTELIQAIAHDLESHANSTRIRKLIFYVCKSIWESDLDTLKAYPLSILIPELIQLYPHLTQLETQLNKVARSLSKPAEYSLTANLILQKIRKLYPETQLSPALASREQQLPQIVSNLTRDKNSIRIKKILVYSCRNVWENDSDRLNQYNLKDLIEELLEIAPTLENLDLVLNSIVKTLNRQTEYSLVANTIITQLDKLYPKQLDRTQPLVNDDNTQVLAQTEHTSLLVEAPQKAHDFPKSTSYLEIASSLEAQQEHIRIKKLIFCACRNYWENDPSNLSEISLEVLVKELHAIAPTIIELKLLLNNVVNTLNRKTEYFLIAETIIQIFETLYSNAHHSAQAVQPLNYQTQIISTEAIAHARPLQLESPLVPALESSYNPFELRLEIMKYTNPLRAKILLFSVLKHKFSFTTADWSALKSYGFDDLLQQLLEQCDTLSTLESRLEIIASCLEDSFEYNQAAGAIIQGVRPFYSLMQRQQNLASVTPIASSAYSGHLVSEHTKVKLGTEITLLTSSHTMAETDDEHTCQFFSASDKSRTAVERSLNDLDQTCELSDNSYEC